jgi:hypothetical protein
MKSISARLQTITTARRALIIQRVIVDDWTIDKAAATFGVPEHAVAAWVLDYRRRGMASLRSGSSHTLTAELAQGMISRPLRAVFRRIWLGLQKVAAVDAAVQPSPLRQSNQDGQR